MDERLSLRESARGLVFEVLQLVREEGRAALHSIAPEYRVLRALVTAGTLALSAGIIASFLIASSVALALAEAMPAWASFLLVGAIIGALGAFFAVRARRVWLNWRSVSHPLVVPPGRSIH